MTDLHVEAYGSGEPALLVHGSGSWGLNTFSQQRALADEFRVIVIDRRGYGRSPAAERHALARRINGRLVTFTRSTHAPQAEEPGAFNALLRDTWRATSAATGRGREPGSGQPG
jgi:pimeloyl-ACP methyl ester carboxylesterase